MVTVQSGSLADRQDCTDRGSEEVHCPSLFSWDFLCSLHGLSDVASTGQLQGSPSSPSPSNTYNSGC